MRLCGEPPALAGRHQQPHGHRGARKQQLQHLSQYLGHFPARWEWCRVFPVNLRPTITGDNGISYRVPDAVRRSSSPTLPHRSHVMDPPTVVSCRSLVGNRRSPLGAWRGLCTIPTKFRHPSFLLLLLLHLAPGEIHTLCRCDLRTHCQTMPRWGASINTTRKMIVAVSTTTAPEATLM